MRKLSGLLVFFFAILTFNQHILFAKVSQVSKTSEQNLSSYIGKYPSDLLRTNPRLKARLRALLGANYSAFTQRLQVEAPIEGDQNALVLHGCMAHSCGDEEALLVITLPDNKLHSAILSQKFGGNYKIFSEDKSHIPSALQRAMNKK